MMTKSAGPGARLPAPLSAEWVTGTLPPTLGVWVP